MKLGWTAALALVAGCSWLEHTQDDDAVIRLIPKNEEEATLRVTAAEFRRALARRRVQVSGSVEAPPLPTEAQTAVLRELVEAELFAAEAQRRNLTITSSAVEAELAMILSGLPEAQARQRLNQTYQTQDHLRDSIRQRLLTQALLAREPSIRVSPEELQAAWAALPEERKQVPARVRAGQIVVATEPVAKQVKKALAAGDSFEALAVQYSVAPNGKAGGYLGWFARGEMPEIVESNCFSLKTGSVSDIVPSEYGYHLFKVYERTERGTLTKAEGLALLKPVLRDEHLRRTRDQVRERLRGRYTEERETERIEEVMRWGR